MKSIDWNEASELGLVERINREVLHPLGLAMSRNPETGTSDKLLIADDGIWEYSPDMKSTLKTDSEVKAAIQSK